MPRVGLIGCGRHMFEFLAGALKWTPGADVVAACDIDEENLSRIARIYNVGRLYQDAAEMFANQALDVVVISVGHDRNYALIETALEAGVHVFVEKTPCRTAEQARQLSRISRTVGKTVMVGFNRRFMTGYRLAKEASSRAEFGPIRMYHSQFHATPYRSDDFLRINHIIHHLDLARFLMGEIELTHVDRVEVDAQRIAYNIAFSAGSRGIGTIQSASLLDERYPMERLELIGSGRNIVVDNIKNFTYNRPATAKETFQPLELNDSADALVWNPSHGYYPRYSHHGYENELRHFFDCIERGTTPEPTIEDSARTLDLVEDLERLLRVGSN